MSATASPDDADLVARALADRHEFAQLYRRYVDPVYRFCYGRLGNREDAEDVTSQVFINAMRSLPSFHGGSFPAWLFTIARHATTDALRARRPAHPLDETFDLPDHDATPEDLAIAATSRAELDRLLAHLTPDQRQVIELRLCDLTGNQIAEITGKTRNAVGTLQHRALARLRQLAERERF